MHSKSKQNKTSTYFFCLANNYSKGTGTGGNEYNLLPRGCRLSKQQGINFAFTAHGVVHAWLRAHRQCLKPRGNSPAIEPILLQLTGVPSPISSPPCPALGNDWITKQRYLWLNKGWHPQVGIRGQNVTLWTTSETLVFMPEVRLCTGRSLNCVRKLWKEHARRSSWCSDLCHRVMESGARPTLNGWMELFSLWNPKIQSRRKLLYALLLFLNGFLVTVSIFFAEREQDSDDLFWEILWNGTKPAFKQYHCARSCTLIHLVFAQYICPRYLHA